VAIEAEVMWAQVEVEVEAELTEVDDMLSENGHYSQLRFVWVQTSFA